MKTFYIAVDFDGTLVSHRFPEIGVEAPEAIKTLKELQNKGAKLILCTMRGYDHGLDPVTKSLVPVEDKSKSVLQDAIDWCHDRGINFYSINSNPSQIFWTTSKKIYANLYIDDAAIGTPMTNINGEKIVDWTEIRKILGL